MTNHDNTWLASCKWKYTSFAVLCLSKTGAQRSEVSEAGSMEWNMNVNRVKLNDRFFWEYLFRLWLRGGDFRSLDNKETEQNKIFLSFNPQICRLSTVMQNNVFLAIIRRILIHLSLLWDFVCLNVFNLQCAHPLIAMTKTNVSKM